MRHRVPIFLLLALAYAILLGSRAGADGYSNVPVGSIVLWSGTIASIPAGWQLCDGTNGTPDLRNRFMKCVGASEDPGATGGAASQSYTPAGTCSTPTFTGSAGTVPAETISWPASVPTFSGSALGTHTHTFTGTAFAQTKFTTNASGSLATTTATPAGTNASVSAGTPAGTVAWPASVPTNGTVSFTPAGTVTAPTFTGSSSSIPTEPAYYKVALIQKIN